MTMQQTQARRQLAARKAAATRARNKAAAIARRQEIAKREKEHDEAWEAERPERERQAAERRAYWLDYWRGRIMDAVSGPILTRPDLDAVIADLISWAGSSLGLDTEIPDEPHP